MTWKLDYKTGIFISVVLGMTISLIAAFNTSSDPTSKYMAVAVVLVRYIFICCIVDTVSPQESQYAIGFIATFTTLISATLWVFFVFVVKDEEAIGIWLVFEICEICLWIAGWLFFLVLEIFLLKLDGVKSSPIFAPRIKSIFQNIRFVRGRS